MNMKQTVATVLSTALLISGGATALAAGPDEVAIDTPSISVGQTMPAMLSAKMQVTELGITSGVYPYLVAKEVLPEGSKETAQEIRLNVSEQTFCIDSKTGLPVGIESMKKGDIIQATYSTAMTRSIPPQAAAYAIVVNLDEKAAPAHYLVAEKVTNNADGSVTILTDNGTLFVTVAKDTPITPYQTKNMVKNTDIVEGSRFFAWYDVVLLSMPGQTGATKVVLLPDQTVNTEPKDVSVDQQPLEPTQTAPYRFGTRATVTAVNTETVNGKEQVKSYTLLSDDQTIGTFVANVSANTLLLDNQTGTVMTDALKKDAGVYVYYGGVMTSSIPAQVSAEAILANVNKDTIPARLLTVERSEKEADGSMRFLADNKGLWVTVLKDTPLRNLLDKETVQNTDLRMGTTVLAWYDVVKESMPAQTTATKVVILPQQEATFCIIVDGDMVIDGGKVQNGVAMVPLRTVAEALGFTVTWNAADQSVQLKNDKVQTTVRIGQDLYYHASSVEGMYGMSKPGPLGAAAYVKDGVTYVPAELFSLLGATPTLTGSEMHL